LNKLSSIPRQFGIEELAEMLEETGGSKAIYRQPLVSWQKRQGEKTSINR